jgi:hypothetical protein
VTDGTDCPAYENYQAATIAFLVMNGLMLFFVFSMFVGIWLSGRPKEQKIEMSKSSSLMMLIVYCTANIIPIILAVVFMSSSS